MVQEMALSRSAAMHSRLFLNVLRALVLSFSLPRLRLSLEKIRAQLGSLPCLTAIFGRRGIFLSSAHKSIRPKSVKINRRWHICGLAARSTRAVEFGSVYNPV